MIENINGLLVDTAGPPTGYLRDRVGGLLTGHYRAGRLTLADVQAAHAKLAGASRREYLLVEAVLADEANWA